MKDSSAAILGTRKNMEMCEISLSEVLTWVQGVVGFGGVCGC